MPNGRFWSIGFVSAVGLGVALLFVLRRSLFGDSSPQPLRTTVAAADRTQLTPDPDAKRRFDPDAETEVAFQIGGIRLPQYSTSPATPPNRSAVGTPQDRRRSDRGDTSNTPVAERPASGKTYVVGHGDTLSVIAKRLLGSAARWKEIADLNGIEDPARLKAGQELRIP